MQIIDPRLVGQSYFPPRLKFAQVTGTATQPLNKPVQPKRLKIVEPTNIRGELVSPGSVFEFDCASEAREDYSMLLGSLKAVRVPLDTPLVTIPAPAIPPAMPAPVRETGSSLKELVGVLVTALREASASPRLAKV